MNILFSDLLKEKDYPGPLFVFFSIMVEKSFGEFNT